MALIIDGMEAKTVTLKPAEIDFEKDGRKTKYVDADGKQVTKIQVQSSEYKWVYEDGSTYEDKAYKCLNGKPVAEFSQTTIVKKVEEIPSYEVKYFIKNELTYLLVGKEIKERLKELQESSKVLVFKYVVRGFKVYRAVAEYDKDLDRALMRCYRGDLRKIDLNETTSKKESVESNVETIDLDEIEV